MENATNILDILAQMAATNEGMPEAAQTEAEATATEAEATATEAPAKRRGSVVPSGYKVEYAAKGNASNCGDWLARKLDGFFDILDAKGRSIGFDWETYTTFLQDNGVEIAGKWAALPTSGQAGWVGRYRMNGRQKLERTLLARGVMAIGGEILQIPENWMLAMAAKHPKLDCALFH